MMRLAVFLALACIQLTRQEEVAVAETPKDEVAAPAEKVPGASSLIGKWDLEDEDEDWTEEDEKWLQELQEMLQEDEEEDDYYEDYEADDEWFLNVIQKWVEKYTGKYDKDLVNQLLSWFKEEDASEEGRDDLESGGQVELTNFPDEIKDEEDLVLGGESELDSMRLKRFTSV